MTAMENTNIDKLFGGMNGLWDRIKAASLKMGRATTRVMLQLYFVLKSDNVPGKDKAVIIGALAYQLLPRDLMPRRIFGILGLVDNAATLMIAYKKVQKYVTPAIDQQADEILDKWFGPQEACEIQGR